jgi:fucose permease
MIAVTPLITPFAARIGAGRAVAAGFLLAAAGFGWLALVEASWTYASFVLPMVLLAVGLGVANGPASAGSTAAVEPEQVGAASGISNMARYIGGAVAVAIVATVFNASINTNLDEGASDADALAAGFSSASVLMAIWAACGVALIVFMRRMRIRRTKAIHVAAAASAAFHTIPTEPARERVAA